ncbi:hypothetical protein Tco_0514053 [Tanacetum coccineum]
MFSEAWDHFKDLLRACPHHGFTELHQLNTLYKGLNPSDQDSLNSAAGGNLLERSTDSLNSIYINKSKVRTLRNKLIVSQLKASNVDSSEIASAVASAVTSAMTAMFKQHQVTPAPASVKAVEESCFTCGGAHSYRQCPATDGNTFSSYRDNIQEYVSAAAVNYNQRNSGYRLQSVANQIRPPGFAQPNVQNNQTRIDQGVGSTSGIRACALRNFNLEVMELENSQNNALAKLPMLKLGEYEMWEIRIKQYFQIQDYALWEMTVPSTAEEKICKKNDVKARSLLLMALPNEHQLTFNQKVKRTIAANNDDKNLAFLTTSSPSSTNTINTVNTGVSTGTTKVNIASTETSTARLDMINQRYNVSTAIKWDILLENAEHQGVKITEIGIKMVLDLIRVTRQKMNSSKHCSSSAFTDSEVLIDKSCSKSCLNNYEAQKKQYDDLLVKLDDTGFKASTYKRGLSILEAHVKEEKEGFKFKIAKFEKSSKDLDDLLASQVTDKSKRGFGYNDVPSPHPLILNRPTPLDLSYSGLKEFTQLEENTDDSLKQQHKTVTETSSVKSPLKLEKA